MITSFVDLIMVNFSIIIPHKNIPSLLERCIFSLPQRNDIQIIVIDDNSGKDCIAKLQTLENSCKQYNLSIIYLNKSKTKGAGYARNVGIGQAIGKWIVFADSDDTFETDALNEAFNKYVDSKADVIYFGIKCLDAETNLPRNNAKQAYLDHLYSEKDTENRCRYQIKVPWGKFIKRNLVVRENIKFDETPVGNDAWFSLQVGYYANKVEIDYAPIYNWMVRSGSITSNKSKNAILTHLMLSRRLNTFKESHSLSKYRSNILAFIPMLIRANIPVHTAITLCIKNTSTKYLLNDILNVIKMKLSK